MLGSKCDLKTYVRNLGYSLSLTIGGPNHIFSTTSQLNGNLTENNISYEYQFGFRKNHSTTLALIGVIDDIYSSLDNSETVVDIYLDLQKAFDCVNHNILPHKLYNYGVRGVAYEWFISY